MNYYIFIDESGDDVTTTIDKKHPILGLCGVLTSAKEYKPIDMKMDEIKLNIWGNKKVIFCDRHITNRKGAFGLLRSADKNRQFDKQINSLIEKSDYTLICSVILKEPYIMNYPNPPVPMYQTALSFIIERAIFYLDEIIDPNKRLFIVLENRRYEDNKAIKKHFNNILSCGTDYVSAERLNYYGLRLIFRKKKDNVNGLQLADLLAKPISKYALTNNKNKKFKLLDHKFYSGHSNIYGLKIFPLKSKESEAS